MTLSPPGDTIEIILADDDPDDRNFFSEAVDQTPLPLKLILVEDGVKLMKKLEQMQSPPPPDIIFLDINMPIVNGKAILKEIRNNHRYDNVPIIMFSTSNHPADIEETFTAGANRYVSKSFFFENETKVLTNIFRNGWRNLLHQKTRADFYLG